jgi:hypothetical protein
MATASSRAVGTAAVVSAATRARVMEFRAIDKPIRCH